MYFLLIERKFFERKINVFAIKLNFETQSNILHFKNKSTKSTKAQDKSSGI